MCEAQDVPGIPNRRPGATAPASEGRAGHPSRPALVFILSESLGQSKILELLLIPPQPPPHPICLKDALTRPCVS